MNHFKKFKRKGLSFKYIYIYIYIKKYSFVIHSILFLFCLLLFIFLYEMELQELCQALSRAKKKCALLPPTFKGIEVKVKHEAVYMFLK